MQQPQLKKKSKEEKYKEARAAILPLEGKIEAKAVQEISFQNDLSFYCVFCSRTFARNSIRKQPHSHGSERESSGGGPFIYEGLCGIFYLTNCLCFYF